jgi:hypothetical protein
LRILTSQNDSMLHFSNPWYSIFRQIWHLDAINLQISQNHSMAMKVF